MNGITIFDNDTVIVKIDKLKSMIDNSIWNQMRKLEGRISELISDQDRIVPKKQVLEMLDISSSTYDNWIKNGTLKACKVGDKSVVYMSDIRNSIKRVN